MILSSLMKDKLGIKIIKEFFCIKSKAYSYLTNSNDEDKNAKDTNIFVIKLNLKLKDLKHWLEATKLEHRITH